MIRDTALIFGRQLRLSLRNPVWTMLGMTQPILYFALFGPLLAGIVTLPGFSPGSSWQEIIVPALMVQLGLFGTAFVGYTIIAERRDGVIERMRATPVSRLALLAGRVLRDVVVLVVQSLILVGVAIAFGLRAPLLGIAVAFGFVVLLAVAMASLSYAAGLALADENALGALLNSLLAPLLLLSGILLPIGPLAPGWLDAISRFNPFRHIVDGMREAFQGTFASGPMVIGSSVAVAFAVIAVLIGTRAFRNEPS